MNRKSALLLVLAVSFVLFTGCSDHSERTNDLNGYSASLFSVPCEAGYSEYVNNVLFDDGKLYVTVSKTDNDSDESTPTSSVYCVDENCKQLSHIEFEGLINPDCIVNGRLAYISDAKEVVFIDPVSGDTTNSFPIDSLCEPMKVIGSDDGYYVILYGEIQKCDLEGNVISRINDDRLMQYNFNCPLYEDSGKVYVILEEMEGYMFYEADFDNGSLVQLASGSELGITEGLCYGKYIFNSTGEYQIDFENSCVKQIADYNNINIIPPSKAGSSLEYSLDDNHFCRVYEYNDGTCDVVLLSYDNTVDYTSATRIVVGGYHTKDDLILAQAVYRFNSTHDDYRVVLEDYSGMFVPEVSSGIIAQDLFTEQLQMLQYFNNGGAPDVFYGNDFDYNQFGVSGMVQDLTPYMTGDTDISVLQDSIENAIAVQGHCYSIFPAYILNGYWGSEEVFGDDPEVSYTDLEQLDVPDKLFGNTYDYNLVAMVMQYNILQVSPVDDKILSEEQIAEILRFAEDEGLPSDASFDMVELPNFAEVARGDYALAISGLWDIYDYAGRESETGTSFRYIGYPTVNGSVHIAEPRCQLAMSAGAANPDICWEFMKCILSDEVQDYCLSSALIPVTEKGINELLEYSVNPENVPQDNKVLYGFFVNRDPVSADVADDFLKAVNAVDTIYSFDWGIYSIIQEEVSSIAFENKSIEEVAVTLKTRLDTYISENCQY